MKCGSSGKEEAHTQFDDLLERGPETDHLIQRHLDVVGRANPVTQRNGLATTDLIQYSNRYKTPIGGWSVPGCE